MVNDSFEVQDEYHKSIINATIPPGDEDHVYDQCHLYVSTAGANRTIHKCTEWVYETTVYKNTFAKQVRFEILLKMFIVKCRKVKW